MWKRAAEHGRRLHEAAPLVAERNLAVEFRSPSEPSALSEGGVAQVTIRSRKVTIPPEPAILLRMELLVERFHFARLALPGVE